MTDFIQNLYQPEKVSAVQLDRSKKPWKLKGLSIKKADTYIIYVKDKLFSPVRCDTLVKLENRLVRLARMGVEESCIVSYKKTAVSNISIEMTN